VSNEAKIIQETDEFVDVLLPAGDHAEMEADRGMKIKEWTERFVAAANAVIQEFDRERLAATPTEAAKADFFMIEGSPEHLGSKEGRELMEAKALRLIVFRELDAAHYENGYPLPSWTEQAISEDLARHSPALDDRDPEELVPAVREWLQQRRAG
jgi:hypothetical protein